MRALISHAKTLGQAAAIAALLAWQAARADPSPVQAATAGIVAIDGILDEDTWQKGTWQTDFKVLDLPDRPAIVQTRFKVRFDASHLYVGIEADEPEPDSLRARVTKRDGEVYGDDCVEVMVDPTGERVEYYHFAVNALGTLYDSRRLQGGHLGIVAWNSSASAAARVVSARWTAELRIPLAELGLTAASTSEWSFNVARERRVAPGELSTYAPLTGGFHQPAFYPALQLAGADVDPFLWEIGSPYAIRTYPDRDGALVFSARIRIRNAGLRERSFQLRGILDGQPSAWADASLNAGADREYAFRIPRVSQGRQILQIELVDTNVRGRLLARQSTPVEVSFRPLKIDVLRPWYRNSIYATDPIDELVFAVDSDLPEEERTARIILAELNSPAGVSLIRMAQPADLPDTLSLPVSELTPGEYELVVRLVGAGGSATHRASEKIRKLSRVDHEWRIDEEGVLRHSGEPVLPFGWFSVPPEAMADTGHAYNLMQWYSAHWHSVEEVRAYLDRAVAAGTAVALYPYPGPELMDPPSVWGRPLTRAEAEAIRQRVRALKDHPGLFAWYMADEPELRQALPERCRQIYEVVRDEDPHHPCIMLNDTMAGIHEYRDGGDVLMPDPYPCFIKGGLAAQSIEKVGRFIKAAVEAGAGRKAVWITPQGFNYGDYGKKNQRAPNLTELRNQLYQAVVYGARGFLWYTYGHAANYPDLDIGMRWLSFEVADLQEAILAPGADVEIQVRADRPEHLHVSFRRVGDALYLFAVNTATHAQEATIAVPGMEVARLYVVSENRRVDLDAGFFQDRFETYASHIYTTDRRAAEREGLQEVQARIAQADVARRRPGNLAFEDNGTWVEVSSRSRYGSAPDRVLDGVRDGMSWRDGTPGQTPDWLVVRWPGPIRVGRVVVYTVSVAAFEVQIPEGNGWRTAERAAAVGNGALQAEFEAPVETDAIRILVTHLREGEEASIIHEVEAYAE